MVQNYNYITKLGVVIPDTSTTRKQVEDEFKDTFGHDLNVDASTPQGMLITRITEERDAIARNNAQLANQINPDIAGGIFLDAIWRLSAGVRNDVVPVTVYGVTLSGDANTRIPKGSRASAGLLEFELAEEVVIGSGGTATGVFVRTDTTDTSMIGAGELTTITTPVTGWNAVNNLIGSTPWKDKESDAAARRRRRETMALQTVGTNEAIKSRVLAIPGVVSMNYLENYEHTTQTIAGISLVAHSIWLCVDGGSDDDVARALFDSKCVGTAYNGSTQVTVRDEMSNLDYTVKFDRATPVNLVMTVYVKPINIDVRRLIPEYVVNYSQGLLDGDVSFRVGESVSPYEVAAAINMQNPDISITKVEIGEANQNNQTDTVFAIASDEVARIQTSGVTVVIV